MNAKFIGLMSGTSLDGIDAALVDFASGCRIESSLTIPFPSDLRAALLGVMNDPANVSLDTLGKLDARLGIAFADAVNALLAKTQVSRDNIAAIGCHGQTLWHRPDSDPPFTWQLGDANIVAARTGITTVADFRRKDVALGGQGAPLVPAFHDAVFRSPDEKRAVVNIGGIANITLLNDEAVLGYDTGPGNILMDAWVSANRGETFDRDGAWAASGHVDRDLLERMLFEPFFNQPPPRSTGRELFNLDWIEKQLDDNAGVDTADVQATLAELTAMGISREVVRYDVARVLLCGGGARNPHLRERIAANLPDLAVETTDDYGVDVDYVEAAAFAWLARETLAGRPGSIPSVTGAARAAMLGAIFPA